MLPLTDWPLTARRAVLGVFTDIDDTLTTDGAITPEALQALADLSAAGLFVIPITGRSMGWCEPLMAGVGTAPWPVDAMVAENGGVAIVPKGVCNLSQISLQPLPGMRKPLSKKYKAIYPWQADAHAENTTRMAQVAAQVLAEVPGVALTCDSAGCETDLAFDHAELAHIARFASQLTHFPTDITESARGAGFAQVARAILEAKI